jgi:hypothetical protein
MFGGRNFRATTDADREYSHRDGLEDFRRFKAALARQPKCKSCGVRAATCRRRYEDKSEGFYCGPCSAKSDAADHRAGRQCYVTRMGNREADGPLRGADGFRQWIDRAGRG